MPTAEKSSRQQRRAYKKAYRKATRPFKGLSVLTGVMSALLAVAVGVLTLFDQTAYILMKTEFYNVKQGAAHDDAATAYFTNAMTDEERRDYGAAVCEEVEAEGAVLLRNENDALPLAQGSKVSCFGYASIDPVYGGTGSGATDASTAVSLKEGLEAAGFAVNETLWSFYEGLDGYGRTTPNIHGWGTYTFKEVPWSSYTSDVLDSVAAYGDASIVTIARVGGEGSDIPANDGEGFADGNALALTQEERDLLAQLTELKQNGSVQKIIVLLNSANSIQLDFLCDDAYSIDACLWIGDVGQSGMAAVGKLLSGAEVPSGHLADTFLYDNLSSPAMQNFGSYTYTNADTVELNATGKNAEHYIVYAEGIYVGYRYYETRYEDAVMGTGNAGAYDYSADAAFPFGFGLSYTDFAFSDFAAEYNAAADCFDICVKVTNTGKTYTGKQAVQIYVQSPYTDYDRANGVEKSAVQLAGFAKTQSLAPGQSETVTLQVERRELASYDAKGAGTYILDAGDYYFTVGENAHDAVNNILAAKGFSNTDAPGNAALTVLYHNAALDTATYSVSENGTAISNQFDSADPAYYGQDVVWLSRSDWQGTFPTAVELSITGEMAQALTDEQKASEAETAGMPVTGAKNGRTLAEYIGKDFDDPDWDELLDQLTFAEMAELTGRAFHRTAPASSVGLPGTHDENGPSGLTGRLMMGNLDVTSFPSEDVMAATWNVELVAKVGEAIGEDCLANGYAGLYGPGANTHRTPYGGRNFEYYSEDPTLSSAVCTGEVEALWEKGVAVYLKHCVLNEGETDREGIGTWATEQAIREIYLKAFEKPMQTVETAGIMSSYTRIGCTWNGANKGLLTNVLRGEWGNKGMYISDNTTFNRYMSGIDGVMAGTTMFDSMAGIQYRAIKAQGEGDAALVRALREASHYNLYVMANSSAMNGVGIGDAVEINTPGWLTAVRVLLAVSLAAFVGCTAVTIRRSRRFKAQNPKPGRMQRMHK